MPSFFLTSSSTTSRLLLNGESGVLAQAATLFTTTSDAVLMTGSARLSVFGTIVSDSANALSLAPSAASSVVAIGSSGAMLSLSDAAIEGLVSDQFFLNNAGLIQGAAEAVRVGAVATTGVVADFHVVNSGTIQSNGDLSSENTIEFDQPAGAVVNIANTGTIVNGGAGGAITVRGGRLDLSNSGTIQSRALVPGIVTDLGNDVVTNTGTIIGGLTLNDGSDELTNHGIVTGNLVMGNGSDRLFNTGTITGAVNLADASSAGAIKDTVINAGLIIGDVQLGNGNDIFRSQGGRIEGTVFGGSGDDQYFVDDRLLKIADIAGADTVFASVDFALASGLESLFLAGAAGLKGSGNSGANRLVGGDGDDTLRGGAGDDTLEGGEGDDQLSGGRGNDRLLASGGNDLLRGDSGDDVLDYVDGDATLSGGFGSDTVSFAWVEADPVVLSLATGSGSVGALGSLSVSGIERVEGSAAADVLTGSAGADTLTGGAGGADTLSGGGGNDLIVGLSAADVLTGGGGDDVFAFRAMTDSTAPAADLITDFSRPRDKIDLSAIDAEFGNAASSFAFIGTGAFTGGGAGEVRYRIDAVAGTTVIEARQADAVGDDLVILLTGSVNLTADNFIL